MGECLPDGIRIANLESDLDNALDEVLELAEKCKRLEAELERERNAPCAVCTGQKVLLTGEPCTVCSETGLESEEIVGLRMAAFRAEKERDEARAQLAEDQRGHAKERDRIFRALGSWEGSWVDAVVARLAEPSKYFARALESGAELGLCRTAVLNWEDRLNRLEGARIWNAWTAVLCFAAVKREHDAILDEHTDAQQECER